MTSFGFMHSKRPIAVFLFTLIVLSHVVLLIRFFTYYEHPSLILLAVGKEVRKSYGEVIFVPGSGCNPGMGTRERLANAARFYKAKPRPLFLSEGTCSASERVVFSKFMDSLGIELKHVYWDTMSMNSEENVRRLDTWCKLIGARSVLVSTSGFHQRRMRMLINKKTDLECRMAAMPEEIEILSKMSPYKERLIAYSRNEWLKILYLSFLA